ncbi:hypothetical protein, conserved [Leishmania donovani]|uniref:Uncharacterized protein n=1 Tax=Leishmania donovani TaxID=5661 RepID=E9BP22_LEIDO|nr:hypothetical protein, conserved [Leishmania donovani]CBZ37000.1 hypothetical protein, conserved [Leishmania donovani]
MLSSLDAEAHVAAAATSPAANPARSAPGTARRVRPPLLSIALPPIDVDAMSPLMTAPRAEAHASLPSSRASPTPLDADRTSSAGDAAHRRSSWEKMLSADAPQTVPLATSSAITASPRFPVLHLAIHACEDEVAPLQTLYLRLFREAEERAQRQLRVREQRRAAQKPREKERCTPRPHVLSSRCEPTAGQHSASPDAPAPSANGPAQMSSGAAQMRGARSPARASAPMGATVTNSKETEAGHTGEDAACERLYRNATKQAERRERRLQALREAQEADFQANCTFHPSLSQVEEGHRERKPTRRARSHSSGAGGMARARGAEANLGDGRGALPHRAMSSSAAQRTPSRSSRQFSATQEELQAAHPRRLAELWWRTEEETRSSLHTGVPRSKASEPPCTYLEKAKSCRGLIGAGSEHFAHYVKGRQTRSTSTVGPQHCRGALAVSTPRLDSASLSDRPPQSESEPSSAPSGTFGTPQQHTPARSRVREKTTKTSDDGRAAVAPPQVFGRLFRDSDERAAVRAFIELMREKWMHTELYKPKAPSNGASAAARTHRDGQQRSSARQRPPGAQCNKDTTAAIALAVGGAAARESPPRHADTNRPFAVGYTVFDALYAEREELQWRREIRHLQVEGDAETCTFHPFVDARSRVLAEERSRRLSEGNGLAAETVRERRTRTAAGAEAKEATCCAQMHFSDPAFSQPQTERNRRRQEELLTALPHKCSGVVAECCFRPARSQATRSMTEGKRSHLQIIDDHKLAQQLIGARMSCPGNNSVTAAAAATTPLSPSAKRTPRARGMWVPTGATTWDAPPASVKDLAQSTIDRAEGYEVLRSVSPPSPQWHAGLCACIGLELAVRAAGSPVKQHRSQCSIPHGGACVYSSRDANGMPGAAAGSGTAGMHRFKAALEDNAGTVHIATAASSTYLRHLESELQTALEDCSKCV